jgi:hypothetical protein
MAKYSFTTCPCSRVGVFKIFTYVYSSILVITDYPSKGREARAQVQNVIPHKNGIIKVQSGGLILNSNRGEFKNSKTVVKRAPFAEVEC